MSTREELVKAVEDARVSWVSAQDNGVLIDKLSDARVALVAYDVRRFLIPYDKETCHSFVSGADDGGVKCKTHPDAPHGFARNASHNEGRYVCECEHWEENT